MRIALTAIIYPGVVLGNNIIIEDYCIIGVPVTNENNKPTIIGDNAHIRSHSVIYGGNNIGLNFQTGNKVNIRENNIIGDNVSIGTHSVVEHHITIENGVRIHSQAFVPEFSHLSEGAWLGPNVVLTNSKFPNEPDSKSKLSGPLIGRRARIGANSTVLPGVKIGEDTLVGAGSVVTKDVPAGTVVIGNPAVELIKKRGNVK